MKCCFNRQLPRKPFQQFHCMPFAHSSTSRQHFGNILAFQKIRRAIHSAQLQLQRVTAGLTFMANTATCPCKPNERVFSKGSHLKSRKTRMSIRTSYKISESPLVGCSVQIGSHDSFSGVSINWPFSLSRHSLSTLKTSSLA